MPESTAGCTEPAMVDGRYRIIAALGQGATATVYRAHDESLGRDVALKVFLPRLETSDDMQRYHAEVRLAATFNHPVLVTLHDAGIAAGTASQARPYLAMELVDGPNLHTRLRLGPFAAADVARIGSDLADALAYIHGRGVIHRDLKPANILLAGQPAGAVRTKLADFGVARVLEGTRLTSTGATIGTAAYLSPEQASGSALGPPSDIYSLGLVLLECLTRRLEYPGGSAESAVARLHRQPVIPPELGRRWTAILASMTSRDPAARPPAGAVRAELAALAEAGPATVVLPAGLPAAAAVATAVLPARPGRPPFGGAEPDPTLSLAPASGGGGTADTVHDGPAWPETPSPRERTPRPALRHAVRNRWMVAVLAVVAISAVLAAWALVSAPAQQTPAPPAYPAVSGTLGGHLNELQKAVAP
ncbi:MAG TPA: serine/threonine-protein kinase [Micrococcaceae bacterium]